MKTRKMNIIRRGGVIIALLAATSVTIPIAANADIYNDGKYDWFYATNSDGVNTVTLGNGSSACVSSNPSFDAAKIPWTFEKDGTTYVVTRIKAKAFYNWKNLNGELTIPKSVKSIEGNAAFQYAGISKIKSFGGISYIKAWTFANCTKLTSIDFTGVRTIDVNAFQDSTALSVLALRDFTSTTIYANSFKNCTSLRSAWLNVNKVRATELFSGAKSLKTVLIGPNTTTDNQTSGNMLTGTTGCRFFAPNTSVWKQFVPGGTNPTVILYGEGQDLDISVDLEKNILNATCKTEHVLTNIVASAKAFKEDFGLDTVITVPNTIAMTTQLSMDDLQNVTLQTPPWVLTFVVKTQAELDRVLALVDVNTPVIIDIEGISSEEISVKDDHIVAILAKKNVAFMKKTNGLVIVVK